jgi:(5-formylfuran-3-yl)methyl phosphate transaminase
VAERTTARAPARSCMGIVDEAARLERTGRAVIHLEKGELDLDTPDLVKELAIDALRANRTRYSHSTGLPELRQAICDYYARRYGVDVAPDQVIVNAGSSAAMLELFLALLEPGDEVVVPDPGYPAYPSLVQAARGRIVRAPSADAGFAYTAELAGSYCSAATKAIIINFPSNPVGDLAGPAELRAFADLGPLIVADEVYHGLAFDDISHSILEYTTEAVAVGSFSKSFAMTGWRLGYIIVPRWLVPTVTRLHENVFVGTNTFVQWAAVGALEQAEVIQGLIRDELVRRHECLSAGLSRLGLRSVRVPHGGFYVFTRQPTGTGSSAQFAADLLDRTHVAITPGSEFGLGSEGCVRFSMSASVPQITEGLTRLDQFLREGARI